MLDYQAIVDGLVQGDGSACGRKGQETMCLVVGDDDQDYFDSEINHYIGEQYNCAKWHKINTTYTSLPLTYLRTIPDKYIESPFNTYQNVGLPPSAIASPSLAAIDAAYNPAKTDCIFYLHDRYRKIHCTTNYQAHKANVQKYLIGRK